MKDSREQGRVGAAAGACANYPIEGRWSLASQLMGRCSSALQQGRSKVDNLIKLQITEHDPKPGRKGGRKPCSFSLTQEGVQSTLSVPSFICLTSQSLQTSSKVLKDYSLRGQRYNQNSYLQLFHSSVLLNFFLFCSLYLYM